MSKELNKTLDQRIAVLVNEIFTGQLDHTKTIPAVKDLLREVLATVRPEEDTFMYGHGRGVEQFNDFIKGWNMALAEYDENVKEVLGE